MQLAKLRCLHARVSTKHKYSALNSKVRLHFAFVLVNIHTVINRTSSRVAKNECTSIRVNNGIHERFPIRLSKITFIHASVKKKKRFNCISRL